VPRHAPPRHATVSPYRGVKVYGDAYSLLMARLRLGWMASSLMCSWPCGALRTSPLPTPTPPTTLSLLGC
jgi:hypothetical protein